MSPRLRWLLVLGLATVAQAGAGPAGEPAASAWLHAPWDDLLGRYVVADGPGTLVDYAGLAADRDALRAYLADLGTVSRAEFDRWPPERQLAFLINAYNAWTVERVLEAYPDIDSIKDLGSLFTSPWEKAIAPLLGELRSLDDIEHGLIRGSGRYREPRIHFAVNCASASCPALQPRAWRGAELDAQLEAATRAFLSDRRHNRVVDGRLQVSRIFDWYGGDFATGWRDAHSVGQFLALYAEALGLSDTQRLALQAGELAIDYLPYDWELNALRPAGSDTRDVQE